jgi:amino acid adenylation domain-containing protein
MNETLDIDEVVAAVWSDVLGCERPSQEANFFEMAGDSLAAMRASAQLRDLLGIEVPVRSVWDFPVLGQFAAYLRSLSAASAEGRRDASPAESDSGEVAAPLSYAQEGLMFLERAGIAGRAYNVPVILRFRGSLDTAALRESFAEVVRRHEAFRTTFEITEAGASQRVSNAVGISFQTQRIELEPGSRGAARARELMQASALEPFDLERGPLIRALLLEMAPAEHWLLLSVHHIVCDGWSIHKVLIPELCALYARNVGHSASIPAPASSGHIAHAVRQRSQLRGERLEELSRYWRERLEGAPALLALPVDRVRVPMANGKGGGLAFNVPATVTARLRAVARRQGATLFMAVLAVYHGALTQWTGQSDVVVSSPLAGRRTREEERVIGFLANVVALRAQVTPGMSFLQLLEGVKTTCLEAYAHAEMPLERLVALLQLRRDPTYHPLAQVSLSFQQFRRDVLSLPDLEVTWLDDEPVTAKLDLSIHINETEGGLRCICEYAAHLFEAATAQRFCRLFAELLERFSSDPNEAVLVAAPAGSGESRPSQSVGRMRWAHELFARQAALTPNVIAVECGDTRISYGQLDEDSRRLARRLVQRGIGPESVVAILLPRSIAAITALLAVWKAGGGFVAVDPELPSERVELMLDVAGVALTISPRDSIQHFDAGTRAVLLADEFDGETTEVVPVPAERELQPANTAYVIFTSGSTGSPKGVLLEHGALANLVSAQAALFDIKPHDRVLQFARLSFDASIWEIVMALCNGATLFMAIDDGDGGVDHLASMLSEHRVTIATLPPSVLGAMGASEIRSLSRVIAAGEPCQPDTGRSWRKGRRFFNAYGPTETTVCASVGEYVGGGDVPLGRAIANSRLYVLDENLQVVRPGGIGQLYIGGAALGRGYSGNPGLTAARFVADPFSECGERMYRTGDRVRAGRDAEIYFIGREDDQIKLHGYRIEPGEIESALRRHPDVLQAAVVPRARAGVVADLSAYVIARNLTLTGRALRRHASDTLPDYMLPARFIFVDALPLTENGKLDRRRVAEMRSPDAQTVPYEPPISDIERALAAIWAKVLRLEQVGATENFFELGGDSILSLRVQAEAQKRGIEFSLLQLLEKQTIRELAAVAMGDATSNWRSAAAFSLVTPTDAVRAQAAGCVDAYPLSRLQLGMIFHSQWQPQSKVYHAVTSHRVWHALDESVLRKVIRRLVERHEILRTTLHLSGFDEPMQCVHLPGDAPVKCFDLTDMDGPSQEDALAHFLELEHVHGFAFEREPPVRFYGHKLQEGCFQLTLSAHHAILDGWSDAMLLSELYRDYLAAMGGAEPGIGAPLNLGYRDFIAAERRALANPDHVAYWSARVAELNGANHRLLDEKPDGEPAAEEVDCIRVLLGGDLCAAVRKLARQASVPPKSVYFGAHLQVLRVLTGQECAVSGLVLNARPECAQGDELLGLFLNTVPIQLPDGETCWLELVQRAFTLEQEASEHREYPVVEVLSGAAASGALRVMFDYVNPHVYDELAPRLRVEEVKTFARTNFALAACVVVDPFSGDRELLISYNRGELSARKAALFGELYLRILEEMTTRPRELGVTQCLLSSADCERLTKSSAAAPKAIAEASVAELLARQVIQSADRPAVVSGSRTLSYAQLDALAARIASRLRTAGVVPETVVGAYFDRPTDMLIAFLAVLRSGGVFLALDPRLPVRRLSQMLEESQALLILSGGASIDSLPAFSGRVLDMDEIGTGAAVSRTAAAAVRPNNAAYIIYTSGSTGTPKGTVVTHQGLANLVRAVAETISIRRSDRVLQVAPWSVDAAIWEAVTTLCAGAALCVPDRVRGNFVELADAIHAHEVTMLTAPPSVLRSLGEQVFPKLETVVVAGESCPLDFMRLWSGRCRLINAYGPTEATVCATLDQLASADSVVHIGRSLPGVTCHILTANILAVPAGVVGELFIGGEGVGRGYLRRGGLTASRFVASPFIPGERIYRTGDLARLRADGTFEYVGRRDRQVKVRGNRVEIGEIEAALCLCCEVGQAAVVARHKTDGTVYLAAYVAGRSAHGGQPDATALREELGTRVPEYMVPAVIVVLPSLPLTMGGKIDRAALPADEGTQADLDKHAGPETALQAIMATGWAQILEIDTVGIHDDFFKIGGNSLVATRVVAWIRDTLEVDLPIKTLFNCPTVAGLCERIENVRWMKAQEPPELSLQP